MVLPKGIIVLGLNPLISPCSLCLCVIELPFLGLLVKSARCSGINAAIFTEKVQSNVRDHCLLSYIFSPADGGPVRVERSRGEQILAVQ